MVSPTIELLRFDWVGGNMRLRFGYTLSVMLTHATSPRVRGICTRITFESAGAGTPPTVLKVFCGWRFNWVGGFLRTVGDAGPTIELLRFDKTIGKIPADMD